jgi:uncharacterized protein YggE
MNRIQLIAVSFLLSLACTQTTPAAEILPPSVSVQGNGRVFERPDMAQVSVGVVSQSPTATAALTANNAKMTALMTVLKASGIEDKDILTSNFNVSPVYSDQEQSSGTQRPPKILAYRVENTVDAKVRKLASLGAILDAVVRSGANNVNGISFTIAQPEPIYDKARILAVADAKRKAELYASAAGIKLGRVLYINESGTVRPPMPMQTRFMSAGAVESAPIAAGEQEMTSTVEVIYGIEP